MSTVKQAPHGSAYDRGSADSYYGRPRDPHIWPAGTYKGIRVEAVAMSEREIAEYHEGYDYNEKFGDKKNWG